jgi:NADPH-dependent 2,4-dienoyl-CoA reductase/sulfur reductase-like enzyme
VDDAAALIARSPEEHRRRGIDVRLRHEVVAIDLAARTVAVRRLDDGTTYREPFDQLVYATGAMPRQLLVPGVDNRGIYQVATLADGLRLREVVEVEPPRRVVIVGSGYIGIEMAEAFVTRGLEVAMVELGPHVMGTLDPDMGALVSTALREAGVELYLGERVIGFHSEAGQVRVVETDRRTLPTDLVVLGVGVQPRTELAAEAGLPLGVSGAVRVDDRMRTGIPGVWAAGDCAETFHLVSRRPVYLPLGTTANKQGRVCGINIGGGYARFPGVVGTAITSFAQTEIARTGLSEREAQRLGFEYVLGKIEGFTRARYYPGSAPIVVKLLAEKGSGRLLGAQIVGGPGAGKRIDVVATALHAGMRVDEFMALDLAYAPPFSPVWDPLLIAARKAAEQA